MNIGLRIEEKKNDETVQPDWTGENNKQISNSWDAIIWLGDFNSKTDSEVGKAATNYPLTPELK